MIPKRRTQRTALVASRYRSLYGKEITMNDETPKSNGWLVALAGMCAVVVGALLTIGAALVLG